jgi:hypothetical protein
VSLEAIVTNLICKLVANNVFKAILHIKKVMMSFTYEEEMCVNTSQNFINCVKKIENKMGLILYEGRWS